MVSIAIENCNLHRRLALASLQLLGTSPRFLMLGFMLPTAFLSMWISNNATTAMMMPIMEAVLSELEQGQVTKKGETEDNEKGGDKEKSETRHSLGL